MSITVQTDHPTSPPAPRLTSGMTFAMAVAAGIAVANIYYNQPMLGVMERELVGRATGLIPTVTQLGYAAGLILIVPLGDLAERRRLIVGQFCLLAIALVAAASAPTPGLLIIASLLMGMLATVAQQIVPFAAHLAVPERRGATVGTVTSGILCGILLSRTISGFVAEHAGWREMFWLGAPLALAAGAWMALTLPRSRPDGALTYATLMRSLIELWGKHRELRVAAITQSLVFASFTTFWTILSLRLQQPPLSLGADIAGLFGILGTVGIFAAPIAGRVADRRGPHAVVFIGAILTLCSWLIFGLWQSLPGLIVGVILLDFAVQGALVANQHLIYALAPNARARLNTIFMSAMFLGGAGGSAIATVAWNGYGWAGVSLSGAMFATLATAVQLIGLNRGK